MSRRGITTIEAATIVLVIITLVVSSIGVAYLTGVSPKIEELSGKTAVSLLGGERL